MTNPMMKPITRLVLTRPHTHAGQAYAPGQPIEVEAGTADWLLAHGIARPEAEPMQTETEPKPLQRKEPKP